MYVTKALLAAAGREVRYRNWLSLLPRRLMPTLRWLASRPDWHPTHVRTPGSASRRRFGLVSPRSSQN